MNIYGKVEVQFGTILPFILGRVTQRYFQEEHRLRIFTTFENIIVRNDFAHYTIYSYVNVCCESRCFHIQND